MALRRDGLGRLPEGGAIVHGTSRAHLKVFQLVTGFKLERFDSLGFLDMGSGDGDIGMVGRAAVGTPSGQKHRFV